jgi:hypothetical protein
LAIRRLSTTSITSTGGKSSKLWDQETTLGTFESIASASVTSNDFVDFLNIPQNYSHLQLRFTIRDSAAFAERSWFMEFNGNSPTGSNSNHAFYGNGSTTVATASLNQGRFASIIPIIASSGTANVFTAGVADILDYSSSSKKKTVRSMIGHDANGSGVVGLESYLYNSTNPITSIRFYTNVYLVQYSQVSLYGIRGA